MVDGRAPDELLLGTWARSGNMIGLVAAVDGERVTLFDPAERHRADVARTTVQAVPAGAVAVTVSVELPLPHGVEETAVRRWVATLLDPVLRERAYAALMEAELDGGAAVPSPRVDVRAVGGGAVCLCGARLPAPAGAEIACSNCGRLAVGPPTSA